jgi:hypothetical protein
MNNSKNFYLDDDRMKNILLKLSEDGKRKFDSNVLLKTFDYDSQTPKEKMCIKDDHKIFTPSKFSIGVSGNTGGHSEPSIDNILNLIRKKAESERYRHMLDNLTVLNWLEAYNKFNENKRLDIFNKLVNVYDTLSNFFNDHCFGSKDECIVCEITEVKIIDSLQVLECKVK